MSLKSIDMSMAVHKNADIGQLQREMQQKPMIDQAVLADHSTKKSDTSRQRPSKADETDKSGIRSRQEEKNGRKKGARANASGQAGDMQEAKPVDADHPYKGHHIDLSL